MNIIPKTHYDDGKILSNNPENQDIAKDYITAPKEQALDFIVGLFSFERLTMFSIVEFKTSSRKVASDVSQILFNVGIVSCIQEVFDKGFFIMKVKTNNLILRNHLRKMPSYEYTVNDNPPVFGGFSIMDVCKKAKEGLLGNPVVNTWKNEHILPSILLSGKDVIQKIIKFQKDRNIQFSPEQEMNCWEQEDDLNEKVFSAIETWAKQTGTEIIINRRGNVKQYQRKEEF